MAAQMSITQRNFAVKRIRDLYVVKLSELNSEDNAFLTARKDAINVTRAKLKEYFETNGINFADGEPTDVITKVSQIFNVESLIKDLLAKAEIEYPILPATQRVRIIALTPRGYADYGDFHSVAIYKRAQNLLAAYTKSVDTVMLGDSATATVMVEKATLATY